MPTLPTHREFSEDVYTAVESGLSNFFGPVQPALLLATTDSANLFAIDPSALMTRHSLLPIDIVTRMRSIIDSRITLRSLPARIRTLCAFHPPTHLLTWMYVEPDQPHYAPIFDCWLDEASAQLKAANSDHPIGEQTRATAVDTLATFTAGAVKRAVRPCTGTFHHVNPIDVILNLSLAYEEGKKCSGSILFFDAVSLGLTGLRVVIETPFRPLISNTKHVRKFMTSVEDSDFSLVTNNSRVIGISENVISDPLLLDLARKSLKATFSRGRALVTISESCICSAFEGQLSSYPPQLSEDSIKRKFVQIKTFPQDRLDVVLPILTRITTHVRKSSSGCSLVVDWANPSARLAGE